MKPTAHLLPQLSAAHQCPNTNPNSHGDPGPLNQISEKTESIQLTNEYYKQILHKSNLSITNQIKYITIKSNSFTNLN